MQQLPPDFTWLPSTRDEYWNMLEALPPAAMRRGLFLLGEPYDEDPVTEETRFLVFSERGGEYTKGSRPVTLTEFYTL